MKRSPLSFKFIANACGVFTGCEGTSILSDPWLVDGVFEGSWCHFSKLKTTFNDVKHTSAVYISHLHPDHFDERHFDFEKDKPLILLDHGQNFLIKKLEVLGYKNLIKIKDGQTVKFNEFHLTMFAPFAKHNFHNAAVGNLLDSALLLECGGYTALNANDNTLTIDIAKIFKEKYGPITLAMLNYNAAGPYPSCFENLTESEKISEHNRILSRNYEHIIKIISEMKPSYLLPFAGAYVLGGDLHVKNKYLGAATWDECADWIGQHHTGETQVVLLREGDVFDLEKGSSDNKYEPINKLEMEKYVRNELSKLKYPHQSEEMPDLTQLISDMESASMKMIERCRGLNIKSTFKVIINIDGNLLQIFPFFSRKYSRDISERILECSLDLRLLRRILDRRSHWNNAGIGGHINYYRSPNQYEPDLTLALQFFHL